MEGTFSLLAPCFLHPLTPGKARHSSRAFFRAGERRGRPSANSAGPGTLDVLTLVATPHPMWAQHWPGIV